MESHRLVGIDVHVHLKTGERASGGESCASQGASLAARYRTMGLRAVVFDVDQETRTGLRISNDEVAQAVAADSDVLMGFGSVDPYKGRAAVREVERCARELGLKGIKFQPITQAFFPDDPRFYPIYEACSDLGLVVTFHTGTTAISQGAPGGGGLKLKYGRPIPHLDDVAADFPRLRIIGAHPSWPWQEEMLAVAHHKQNVYIDLSGWAPRYFPQSLVHYANTLLQDKCLFGSDHPVIDPARWLREFAELPIKDEVRPKILWQNAARLFGLEGIAEAVGHR